MADAFHISSLVVRALPERVSEIKAAIGAIKGADVFRSDDLGKIVVVLETHDQAEIALCLRTIESLQGVLNASLIYHHIEEDAEENREEL
jgi:periplasmic nitrate reductase NapD